MLDGGTIVGISTTAFSAVIGTLLGTATVAVYNHLRPHSLRRALLAGGTVAVLGMIVLTAIINVTSSSDERAPSGIEAGSSHPLPKPERELDEDEDGLVDAVDSCPYEAGERPSGCPDQDQDGLLDKEDRCPKEAAPTSDGCPARPRLTGLIEYSEDQGYNYDKTENVVLQQVTVAGITDPRGVQMEVGGAYSSADFTVPVNRRFQWLRGRVGITSEPCSAGSVAYVDVRNAEGQRLWPRNGRPRTVHRKAVRFKVLIAAEDSVVLYAEAPEAREGYCGDYYPTTEVGWVHTELISE